MLFGKDLGRCHQGGLIAIFHRGKHRQKSDDRLAAADIALNETVHRSVGFEIGKNLADDLFLSSGQV